MRHSLTLSTYIGRHYLIGILVVLGIMGGLVFLMDVLELLRRSSGKDTVGMQIIIEMALLKLPNMLQKIIPFAVLIGGILTLARLNRSNELVVARSAGVSVWQFLMPAMAVGVALGIFIATLFNPLSAVMLSRYEQIEGKYLKGRASMLAVSSSGLWLRQVTHNADGSNTETIINALRASQRDMELHDVIMFLFAPGNVFTQRLDAETAKLEEGHWNLKNVLITYPSKPAEQMETFTLPTELTPDQIQESFSSPGTLSFWELPGFIDTLEAAGFSALRHRLYWHGILALPFLLCAMIFIGANFALKPPRSSSTGFLLGLGVFCGFVLYFISDIINALGLSGSLPVQLAAWSPATISLAIGIALLLHFEDG